MSGHVGSGNAELCDLRKTNSPILSRTRRRQIKEWANCKIGRQPFEPRLPDEPCAPARAVAGGAMKVEEPFAVAGIGLGKGGEG